MIVEIISFGFKYNNIPASNHQIDVRFLNNPYYVDELKEQTGLDADVIRFFENDVEVQVFLKQLYKWIKFIIEANISAKKEKLVISIGCTGGQHRSPYIVERLGKFVFDEQFVEELFICHNEMRQYNKKYKR